MLVNTQFETCYQPQMFPIVDDWDIHHNNFAPCEISGSHGSEYEDGCLLRCCAV
jgi:hypothetical protein